MLSGEGNENGEKTTIGLISKKATLHVSTLFLYISLPLFCTTTTWNFQKLSSYTFYGVNAARVIIIIIIMIQTALDYHHIPDHIKTLVKSLYTDFKTSILTNEFRTPFISVGRGMVYSKVIA